MPPVILHIDMNAYFASVEQRNNPALQGKALVVVGDLHRRSVVLTASYEARVFGIKTGMVLWQAKELCPQVLAVEAHPECYRDTSRIIAAILEQFTDQMEMTSCDEAFLDVTASRKLLGDGVTIARQIKEKLWQTLGLTCSIGIAPNKLLAKLASDRQKPDGLVVFLPEDVASILETTGVQELCGIGQKLQEKLKALKIRTCGELGRASIDLLYHHFGFWAYHLKRMGQGQDESPVHRPQEKEVIKSMGHSHTLPHNTWDFTIIRGFLVLLAEKVARRLRHGCYRGHTVALILRYSDFETIARHTTLKEATDHGGVIYQAAWGLFQHQTPLQKAVRLLGISVSHLDTAGHQQWLWEDMGKRSRLDQAMDVINNHYGSLTLKPAQVIVAEKFGIMEPPIPPHMHPL